MSNAAATATEGSGRSDAPLHVAIIMDGNGRWRRRVAFRAPKAIAAASRRCAVSFARQMSSAFSI